MSSSSSFAEKTDKEDRQIGRQQDVLERRIIVVGIQPRDPLSIPADRAPYIALNGNLHDPFCLGKALGQRHLIGLGNVPCEVFVRIGFLIFQIPWRQAG